MPSGTEKERARRGQEDPGGRAGTKQRRREKSNRREAPWQGGRKKKISASIARGEQSYKRERGQEGASSLNVRKKKRASEGGKERGRSPERRQSRCFPHA